VDSLPAMTDRTRRVRKAVIPAAGLGTRFLPATKAIPKEMLPVVDKPAIQYVVEEAVAAGLTDVLMVTGRSKRPLEDHFDRVWELEETLEAKGDAAKLAKVRESTDLADVLELVARRARQMADATSAAVLLPEPDGLLRVRGADGRPHLRLTRDQHCAALEGRLGERVRCSIYALRPKACRKVEAGSSRCLEYRRDLGLTSPGIGTRPRSCSRPG